jgi:26S proteasome regulatory subunit T5
MSTLEDLDDLEREGKDENGDRKLNRNGDAEMKDADAADKKEERDEDLIDPEILRASTQDINNRRRLLENELRIMKGEHNRLTHEKATMQEKAKENMEKIENNRYDCVR